MPDQVRHDKVRVLFCRVINFGKREIEIKRKVKDFDKDLPSRRTSRMSFDVLILNILLILSK